MIKVLILTIGIFLNILLESFFLNVFSFSIFVILCISLYKRVDNIWFFLFVFFTTLILDTVLHLHLGIHLLTVSVLLILLEASWLLIPRESIYGYATILILFVLYYLFLPFFNSLVFANINWEILTANIAWVLVKALISLGIYVLMDRGYVFLRKEGQGSQIRLR